MIIEAFFPRSVQRVVKPGLMFLAVCVLSACASTLPKACRIASDHSSIIEAGLGVGIDEALKRELQQGVFSGAVLVTQGDRTILRRGYGCQDQKRHVLNSPEIISDIGSIAKTFTAVGILILEERGDLALDDTLSKFFPDAPVRVGKITLEQVVLHISGLKNYVNLSDFAPMTRDQAERKILNRWLEFEPGERYEYSNAGYTLLAVIIERVTGQSFRSFIKQELLLPLGLVDTGFYLDVDIDEARLAGGYGGWAGRLIGLWGGWRFGDTTHSKELTWTLMGAGGMVSSVDDMSKWFQALSSSPKLPKTVREKIFTAQPISKKSFGHWENFNFKGLDTIQMNGATVFGYIAKIMYLPETDMTVIVAFNSHSNKYGVRTIHKVTHNTILGTIVSDTDASF